MKVNRSTFSKIKTQYEILKMRAAYIEAEKAIMQNPSLTGYEDNVVVKTVMESMSPEKFYAMEMDEFGNTRQLTVGDMQARELEAKIEELKDKGNEALANEDYEKMAYLNELYERAKQQLDKLRGNS